MMITRQQTKYFNVFEECVEMNHDKEEDDWMNQKRKLKRKQMWRVIKADLQMWTVRRCRRSKLQHIHLISITESQFISVSTKNSTDSNSGSDRNVTNVTPTSFIPWHFLIASHTRFNAMHSRATIMRRACIKMLLTNICLPTQTPKSQYYSSFWCSTSISHKGLPSTVSDQQIECSFLWNR